MRIMQEERFLKKISQITFRQSHNALNKKSRQMHGYFAAFNELEIQKRRQKSNTGVR